MDEDQGLPPPGAAVRVVAVHSAAPVEGGDALLFTFKTVAGRLDLVLPHILAPALQRLAAIVAVQADARRRGAPTFQIKAERVSAVTRVLATPDGAVVVSLDTEQGYPLQFALPAALAADLGRQLVATAPTARPPRAH